MGERLRQLSNPAPEPKRADISRVSIAALMVIALAVGTFTLSAAIASSPPANLGWYRVIPPPRFDGDVLSGAPGGGSPVWSDGIWRFPGAVPVTAVYGHDSQPLLYVRGAEGDLLNPAGELAEFWKTTNPLAKLGITLIADAEPAGPLGGSLQCELGMNMCAWADYSGIVVVSLSPPDIDGSSASMDDTASSEQALAELTKSFRAAAESLKPQTGRPA